MHIARFDRAILRNVDFLFDVLEGALAGRGSVQASVCCGYVPHIRIQKLLRRRVQHGSEPESGALLEPFAALLEQVGLQFGTGG